MSKQYQDWKREPFTNNLTPENVVAKINGLIKDINQFYGLVGMSEDEAEGIYAYVFSYLNNFKLFKLIDMDRAFQLHRKAPDMNKLTPAYFENIFNTYRKSPERQEIMKLHSDELEGRVAERTESTTKEHRFNDCLGWWKLTGEIRLGSGAVYTENYQAILSEFGMEKLKAWAEQTKGEYLSRLESTKALLTKMADHHELQSEIDNVKNGGPLLKNAIRRKHLAEWFKQLETQTV